MDELNNYLNLSEGSTWGYLIAIGAFLVLFFVLIFIFNRVLKKLEAKSRRTNSPIDDFIIRLFRIPGIWIIFSVLLHIFASTIKDDTRIFETLKPISRILLILAIGWLFIQTIRAVFRYVQNKYDINNPDNLEARKKLTQLNMIEKILVVVAVVVFVGIALMSIKPLRELGLSVLASAGVVGIIIGLAAQRSVGQILSGVQIAFTQPIRIDDVVVIEGEWGRIEEINITYAVVKIWDERRLIVPIEYFLNTPVQNWTRTTSNILGTVYLYVSYDLPLEPLREHLMAVVKDHPDWDGRVQNIQVTDSKQWYKEIRLMVSSADSSANWDLRVYVREKMIDFINEKYPGSFARINSSVGMLDKMK